MGKDIIYSVTMRISSQDKIEDKIVGNEKYWMKETQRDA